MKLKEDKKNPYADIIDLDRHVSNKRSQMPIKDRAAQFAPFSAVVGHGSAVKEAARHTDKRREIDEMQKSIIDNILREIDADIENHKDIKITYFEPDILKSGGKYIDKIGRVKKIDTYTRQVLMLDGTKITIEEIFSILKNYTG